MIFLLLQDFVILPDWFLGDHSLHYLNWKSDKSQIELTRNSGALTPCVPKTASFVPACDKFIITPEENEIMVQLEGSHRSSLC